MKPAAWSESGSLETESPTIFQWTHYIFLAGMWVITVHGLAEGNQKIEPFCYILPPLTALLLWWLLPFKRVTLLGESLIVHDSSNEVRIPMNSVQSVAEVPLGKGYSYITVTFKSKTEYGRRIRIKTRSLLECNRFAKFLEKAVQAHECKQRTAPASSHHSAQ